MQDSRTQSPQVPKVSQDALPICGAGDVPIRALVRNTTGGGVAIVLAFELEDISNATSNVYQLPDGQSDVFVLAPGQKLYARSTTAAFAAVSVAKSEAFPVVGVVEQGESS